MEELILGTILGCFFVFLIIFIYKAIDKAIGSLKAKSSDNEDSEHTQQPQVKNNDPRQSVVETAVVRENRVNPAPRPEREMPKTPAAPEKIKVCRFCGHLYEPGETFCPNCGAVETEIKM